MPRGKKLTFKMKRYIGGRMKLNPDEWLYTKNTNEVLVIVNKTTKEIKEINKIARRITSF